MNCYALGSYGVNTETTVTTFPEERRQWRVKIEKHVTKKAEEINQNVDEAEEAIIDRIDTAESNIIEKIDNVNNYLVETIKPKLDDIEEKVDGVNHYVTGQLTQYVDEVESVDKTQNTLLQNIYDKVRVLPSTWYWGN